MSGGGKRASAPMKAIWLAQGKCCAVCGVRMLPIHKHHPTRGWTFEHVYPNGARLYVTEGNRLVTHAECNNLKAFRMPTGCEVLLLHAVNAQLGLELTPRGGAWWREQSKGPSALALALQKVGLAA